MNEDKNCNRSQGLDLVGILVTISKILCFVHYIHQWNNSHVFPPFSGGVGPFLNLDITQSK